MIHAKGREFTLRRTMQHMLSTNSKTGSNNNSGTASPSSLPHSPMNDMLSDDARSNGSSVISIGGTSRIKDWFKLGIGTVNSANIEYMKDLQFRCEDAKVRYVDCDVNVMVIYVYYYLCMHAMSNAHLFICIARLAWCGQCC